MSNYDRSLDGRQDSSHNSNNNSSSNNNNNNHRGLNHHQLLSLEGVLGNQFDEQQQQNVLLPHLNSDASTSAARLVERLSMQASLQANPATGLGGGQPILPAHLQAHLQAQLSQGPTGAGPQFVIVPTSAFGWQGIPGGIPGIPGGIPGLPSMFLPAQLAAQGGLSGGGGASLPVQIPSGLGPLGSQNLPSAQGLMQLPNSMNYNPLGSQLAFLTAQQQAAAAAPYLGATLPAPSTAAAATVADPVVAAAAATTRTVPPVAQMNPTAAPGSQASTAASSESGAVPVGTLTGRPPVPLYLDCDEDTLSEYQCLLRKQIELFEATADDVRGNAQGRNTPILLGQVGIRCRHCAHLPVAGRTRGAVYFSQTIDGIYQVAQNMSKVHLSQRCHRVPEDIQRRLQRLRGVKTRGSGGKQYWADGVRALGIYESGRSLCFTATGGVVPGMRASSAASASGSQNSNS